MSGTNKRRVLGNMRREFAEPNPNEFYERFIEELDAITIMADDPAAHIVGLLTRAAKRAQLVVEGTIPPVASRPPAPLAGESR